MKLAAALVLLLIEAAHGFVYSCNEIKYRLINTGPQVSTDFACIALEQNFPSISAIQNIYVQSSTVSISLAELAMLPRGCIENGIGGGPWSIVAHPKVELKCDREFSLSFTSSRSPFTSATDDTVRGTGFNDRVFVSPAGGMVMQMKHCCGRGNLTWFTGAGTGETEQRYPLKSWKCSDLPKWIVSFENVITIVADRGLVYHFTLTSDYSTQLPMNRGDRAVILTSGLSDNMQNIKGVSNRAAFATSEPMGIIASGWVDLNTQYYANINFSIVYDGNMEEITYETSGTVNWKLDAVSNVQVEYRTAEGIAGEAPEHQDTFVIELTSGAVQSTTVSPSKSTTKPPSGEPGPYCGCKLDGSNKAVEWNPSEIWLDIVVILDTSEAMGEDSLSSASKMIDYFVSDGVLVTDPSAPFSTRVGLISMAADAEILYDMNMTSADRVEGKAHIAKGLDYIDVVDAFDAALEMFTRGVRTRPDREDYRQVIYYITNSDPKVNLNPLNEFKTSQGIIIVNNFLSDGDVERPGLKELASDGFYLKNTRDDYMVPIQAFCKANCFCAGDRDAYAGKFPDPTVKAAGGCYHPVSAGVPFAKAQQTCADLRGGLIALVHDDDKACFLSDLVLSVYNKKYFFWIGYSRDKEGNWEWEDKSTDSYTNWDTNEPSAAYIANCAYADMAQDNLPWGAGNCEIGMPYVCEHVPCSTGNKIC